MIHLLSQQSPTMQWSSKLCLLVFLLLQCSLSTADIRFKRLLDAESLAGDGIGATTGIVQDHYGFMWIGGENGLIRYDGATTKHYTHEPQNISLIHNYIRAIIVDNSGVIWVGTDLGLCQFDPLIDNFRCLSNEPLNPNSLSGNTIYALQVDINNNLYIGTNNGLNILHENRTTFTHHFVESDTHPNAQFSAIRSLLLDESELLWIGTEDSGVGSFNIYSKEVTHYPLISGNTSNTSTLAILTILKDHQDNLWFGTFGGGISRFDLTTKTFHIYQHKPDDPHSIGNDVIWDSYQDSTGKIWFATDHGGVAVYDEKHDYFINYRHSSSDTTTISSNQVKAIFEDNSGNLWFGTFPSGVSYIDKPTQLFTHWKALPNEPNGLTHSSILSLLQDSDDNIWIGTENGLNVYDYKTEKFTQYYPYIGKEGALQGGPVLTLEEAENGDIWVGTWSGGLHRFDKKNKSFIHYPGQPDNPTANPTDFIWKIIRDQNNQLWIGTENYGLVSYDSKTDSFTRFVHDNDDPNSLSFDYVMNLLEDSSNNFWVATLEGFDLFDRETKIFQHLKPAFTSNKIGTNKVATTRYLSILEDQMGRIWVGTQNYGIFIYTPNTGEIKQLETSLGLPSNFIPSMVLDDEQYVWATTSNGVAKINTRDTKEISVLTQKNGLSGNSFNRDATLKDRNGKIYLGSIDGVTVFNPKDIPSRNPNIPVLIKNFLLFNKPILPTDQNSLIQKSILDTEKIILNYEDSMITFEFIGLNYQSPETTQYAYQLIGFDEDWNYVGDNRFATYTNLDHGNYTFRVKAKTDSNEWSKDVAQLKLKVLPPLWKTWWALALYTLFILGAIRFSIRMQNKRVELKSEKSINSQLRKLNNIKDAFLANTSHELRTPLNGIIGIAESVVEEAPSQMDESLKHKLHLIVLSGKRLSGLINDILDYTKLGHNTLKISPQATSLFDISNEAVELLLPLLEGKRIRLTNNISPSTPLVYADENRLQQILLNLIGNSIKFTEFGYIRISAEETRGFIKVHVEDSGIGISKTQAINVFGAFQQIDSDHASGGTGLGLAVTKELVELHGGKIELESELHEGAKFSFTLPLSDVIKSRSRSIGSEQKTTTREGKSPKNALYIPSLSTPKISGQKIPLETTPSKAMPLKSETTNNVSISKALEDASQYTILIVDDDAINRMVLSSMLKLHNYTIAEAIDGSSALEYIKYNHVDLVILDVMMPKMTGYEVCTIVRKQYALHEMPILFLTAKKVDADVATGFSVGGNEYLSKPVSKYELLPRVANHIRLLQVYRSLKLKS